MDTKPGNSAEPIASDGGNVEPPPPQTGRRRPLLFGILFLGVLVLATLALAIVFGSGRRVPQTAVRGLAQEISSESSPGSAEPIIPLALLFPENTPSRAPRPPVTAVESGLRDSRPEMAAPIPGTASEVVEETRRVADELAEQFPDDPDSLEIAARMHLWLGDSQTAARAWERCLTLDSHYRYAFEGLGILAVKRGDYEEAISQYRRALEGAMDAPGMLGTRIRLAGVLIDHGQPEEAIRLLEGDTRTTPIAPEVLVSLGKAHLQLKQYVEARKCYEAALSSQPKHTDACFGLATVCSRLGDHGAASRYLERFRELRSGERAIRTDERSHFDDVEEMREHLAKMHENAGRLYHAHSDLAQAEEHWRRAAALDRKAVDCRQAVAWFCQQAGRTRDAIAMLGELARIEPDNPAYLLEVGRLQATLGEYDQAEATLEGLREKMPACADAQASLARLYLQTGREFERAAELAGSAAAIEPTQENVLLLAAACERSGKLADAASAMERLTLAAPERSDYQRIHQELRNRLPQENAP